MIVKLVKIRKFINTNTILLLFLIILRKIIGSNKIMEDLRKLPVEKLLDMAYKSSCIQELNKLCNIESMIVRRVVAKNRNINSYIANNLATDPVLNVSYIALKNPNCTIKRDLHENELVKCVVCDKDERYMNCTLCN
ncbi:hypothetical protein CP960_11035 [Malaciobacter halophilus]|uniref:Uncharacterized protein n=2 Tax=Malaciobacter halophilus TaxID=197482 RepID=A0A2N1J0S4_9BACT|nr:hypothetical protein CP960_11035 [Malaciobacter halophilus]